MLKSHINYYTLTIKINSHIGFLIADNKVQFLCLIQIHLVIILLFVFLMKLFSALNEELYLPEISTKTPIKLYNAMVQKMPVIIPFNFPELLVCAIICTMKCFETI